MPTWKVKRRCAIPRKSKSTAYRQSFTALGILHLAQKGLLDLDDRLGDHLEILMRDISR